MKLPGTATAEENIHIAMGKLAIRPGDLFLLAPVTTTLSRGASAGGHLTG